MCICGKMSPYNGKKHKRWHLHQSKPDSKLFHLVFDVTLPAIVTGWREIYFSVFLILQLEFYNRQKRFIGLWIRHSATAKHPDGIRTILFTSRLLSSAQCNRSAELEE